MMKKLTHKFVSIIPERIDQGILFISMDYKTAIHLCACGCGSEIVTPLSPTDWELIFDGETVSLYPSIGNWSLPCQSHYWIKKGKIKLAPTWTQNQIKENREKPGRKSVLDFFKFY